MYELQFHIIKQNSSIVTPKISGLTILLNSTLLLTYNFGHLPGIFNKQLYCSLDPGVERLAFSVVFHINAEGQVVKEAAGRSIIKSKAKCTTVKVQVTKPGILARTCYFPIKQYN